MTNIDNFFADVEAEEPKTITINGEVYTLPAKLPAKVMLRFGRKTKDSDAALEAYEDFLRSMFGAEQLEKLLDTNITFEGLSKVVTAIINFYVDGSKESPNARRGK